MISIALVLSALTAIYAMTIASFAWEDILSGFVISSALVFVYRRTVQPSRWADGRFLLLAIVYFPRIAIMILSDIFGGTWLVATITVGLRPLRSPRILRIPMGDHSDAAVGIVSFILTMSPSSYVVDLDWDGRVMLVHYVDASDPDKLFARAERYFWLWDRWGETAVRRMGEEGAS